MQRRRGRRSRRPSVGEHLPVDPSLPQLLLRLHYGDPRSHAQRYRECTVVSRTCGARSLRESRDCRLWLHNSPFDEGCLRAVHAHYGLPYPDYRFLCTLSASRRRIKGLPNYQLHTVSAACGYLLERHHHARPTPKPVRDRPCGFSDSSAAHPYRAGISLTNIEIRFVSYFWVKSFAGGAGITLRVRAAEGGAAGRFRIRACFCRRLRL